MAAEEEDPATETAELLSSSQWFSLPSSSCFIIIIPSGIPSPCSPGGDESSMATTSVSSTLGYIVGAAVVNIFRCGRLLEAALWKRKGKVLTSFEI